jgi:hypothetical protein
MIYNSQKSGASVPPKTMSVLLGFSISLLLAVPSLVFGRHGIWQMIYWNVGLPFDILLGLTILRHDVVASLPKACKPVIGILGGFVTWGLFFSWMIYGHLCKRELVSDEQISDHLKGDRLRTIATAILVLGACFSVIGCVLNAYRASSGCGPDYSPPFELFEAVAAGAVLGLPIILIVIFCWLFRSGTMGNVVTMSLAAFYAVVSGYAAVSNAIAGYAPCDRKGDESSAAVLLFGLFILWLWMFLYSVSVIECVPRRSIGISQEPGRCEPPHTKV